MNIEDIENTWRAQPHGAIMIDTTVLVREVRRSARYFHATVFWRDFREVAICMILVPIYYYVGVRMELPWTWYLGIPAALWIAVYIVADRVAQRRKHPAPADSLKECIDHSIAQVEHQIQLLRGVFWWYLLPCCIAITAFFLHVGWNMMLGGIATAIIAAAVIAILFAFAAAIFWSVYRLNQAAVRDELEPRLAELMKIRKHLLENET